MKRYVYKESLKIGDENEEKRLAGQKIENGFRVNGVFISKSNFVFC
jgi:hypothetical protein